MEPYEFRYSLNNITPKDAKWSSVDIEPVEEIEKKITSPAFFDSIQITIFSLFVPLTVWAFRGSDYI
jgi:hypothetical protein